MNLHAKTHFFGHENLVTPTLYYTQIITSKVLSSGILSPEEGLGFAVFSKYDILCT